MRKKLSWCVVAVLILSLVLMALSCGGTTQAPVEEQKVEEPKAEEPTTPTRVATTTPHPLEGREDCLQCHGEGAFKPFPANHAGRTNDTCTTCHQPAK